MIWANAYVGLPWADLGRDRTGCDCWGLARLVYAEQLGIALPYGGYRRDRSRRLQRGAPPLGPATSS